MYSDKSIKRDGVAPIMLRIIWKIRRTTAPLFRQHLNRKMQEKLKNIQFTIFSNNCLGGVFYHDAGQMFTSPLINVALDGPDFIRFLEKPQYYLEKEINFYDVPNINFPVGCIEDVEIHFVHYKTNDEAKEAWDKRKKRINWENIYIIATDHDGMNASELLDRFDKLEYKNKIMFTSKNYSQYPWAIQVSRFKHRDNVRIMTSFANVFGQRYYETCFDIAEWIKKNSLKEKKSSK